VLRPLKVALASLGGVLAAEALFGFSGHSRIVEAVSSKWRVEQYGILFSLVFFLCDATRLWLMRRGRRWVLEIAVGATLGVLSALVSLTLGIGLGQGLESLVRGLDDFGWLFPFLVVGLTLFPYLAWVYGAVAGVTSAYLLDLLDRSKRRAENARRGSPD
jgi:hypothetical protein